MLTLAALLVACEPATMAIDDTDAAPAATVSRLRCTYEHGEGLTLADGQVGDREAADLGCYLGRYITLSALAEIPGGAGRLCEVGVFDALADVPGDCPTADGWTPHLLCAVNSDAAPPACVGVGLVVRPREGDAVYRLRVVSDDLTVDGDFLAGISFDYAR